MRTQYEFRSRVNMHVPVQLLVDSWPGCLAEQRDGGDQLHLHHHPQLESAHVRHIHPHMWTQLRDKIRHAVRLLYDIHALLSTTILNWNVHKFGTFTLTCELNSGTKNVMRYVYYMIFMYCYLLPSSTGMYTSSAHSPSHVNSTPGLKTSWGTYIIWYSCIAISYHPQLECTHLRHIYPHMWTQLRDTIRHEVGTICMTKLFVQIINLEQKKVSNSKINKIKNLTYLAKYNELRFRKWN